MQQQQQQHWWWRLRTVAAETAVATVVAGCDGQGGRVQQQLQQFPLPVRAPAAPAAAMSLADSWQNWAAVATAEAVRVLSRTQRGFRRQQLVFSCLICATGGVGAGVSLPPLMTAGAPCPPFGGAGGGNHIDSTGTGTKQLFHCTNVVCSADIMVINGGAR